MADLVDDGMIKVAWAATIANIHAPTAAELNAAKDFTARITPDGLKTDPTTASVDTSSLASTFSTSGAGRRSFANELTFKRGDTPTDDLPYTTLAYQVQGYLVVRRGVAYATNFTAGDIVEVYPSICGEPQHVAPSPSTVGKLTVGMMNTADPDTKALVA